MNTILYDYVCEELEDVERDGLKAGNLDSTDKLVNIKKNLLKIISTHTPHAGRDMHPKAYHISCMISTHTPHAGRDGV